MSFKITCRRADSPANLDIDTHLLVAAVFALTLAAIFIFFPADLNTVLHAWRADGPISHGYLTLIISIAVILTRPVAAVDQKLHIPSFILLAILLTVYWFASFSEIVAARLLALTFLIPAAAGSIFGKAFLKLFSKFSALLFGAMPIFNGIAPLLQWVTVKVTQPLLMLLKIPAFVFGTYIQLPTGIISVEEGCSGVHFFTVSLVLGTLVWILHFTTRKAALGVLAAFVLQSLLANWIRVSALTVIGYHTAFTSSLMEKHMTFGWAIYCVTLFPVYYFLSRFAKRPTRNSSPTHSQISLRHLGYTLLVIAMTAATIGLIKLENRSAIADRGKPPATLAINEIGCATTATVVHAERQQLLNFPLDVPVNVSCLAGHFSIIAQLPKAAAAENTDDDAPLKIRAPVFADSGINRFFNASIQATASGNELSAETNLVGTTLTPSLRKAKIHQLLNLLQQNKTPVISLSIRATCFNDCRREAQQLVELIQP